MPSSVRLIRRYVWLIDTIRRAGRITLEDINRRWLAKQSLRLGPDAEVLSPAWLRDELKYLAAETANRYPDI